MKTVGSPQAAHEMALHLSAPPPKLLRVPLLIPYYLHNLNPTPASCTCCTHRTGGACWALLAASQQRPSTWAS
jgi:hypothetical protein